MFFNYEDKARFGFLLFLFLGNEIQIVRADGAVKNKSCLLASTGAQRSDAYIRSRWMHCWQQALRRASQAFTDGTDGLICDVCVSHGSGFVVFKALRACVVLLNIKNSNSKYAVLREIPFQSLFTPINIANWIFIDQSHQNVLFALHFISWIAWSVILLVYLFVFIFFFLKTLFLNNSIATPQQPIWKLLVTA